MSQSARARLNDYEALLTGTSNVIVNPINELVSSIPANFGSRNGQATSNYYQASYQTGYCPPPPSNLQSNQQPGQQLKQQQIANHPYAGQSFNGQPASAQFNVGPPNDYLQPVSNSSTASTALLQTKPFQTSITQNGLNSQLITPPKLTTSKPKSNAISIWPINRSKRTNYSQSTSAVLSLNNGSRPQLISKLNRSSFTFHLLTCALITGIVTLLLIVITSICLYSSCKFI